MPRLLFATRKPFYPDSSGGAQRSSLYIFNSLKQKGWEIEVICLFPLRLSSIKRVGWKITTLPISFFSTIDKDLGYICRRKISLKKLPGAKQIDVNQWNKWLDSRLEMFKPDIVLGDSSASSPLIRRAIHRGYKSIHIARSIPFLSVPSIIPPELHLIGNSIYMAGVIEAVTQKKVDVVLPLVDHEEYRVKNRKRHYITFINPIPQKGVDLAIEMARAMPEKSFLFVKGRWSGFSSRHLESFVKPARKLPNVDVWEHQDDMRAVYEMTNILLLPSQFIETFGRVIVEANINGIPVVAANVGGIPYALGKGGILINPINNLGGYLKALRKICGDQSLYEKLSKLALQNSRRKEFAPEYQMEKFLRIINRVMNGG